MNANKKTILLSIVGAIVASILVQQIAYRNSMEFKLKETLIQGEQREKQEQERAEREEAQKCKNYEQLKAGNPQWEPTGDYYDSCK